jgi:N-acyl-D-amino-acid deacylase
VLTRGGGNRKKGTKMAYDLLIKNGRIVDGSGMPAFRGDVGAKDGKIVELGKLSGPAARTVDAAGRAVAPGFVDNHCHYDAQVTWDPLCSFSPDHGATTVVFGNCSLSLAPVRRGSEKRVAEFLSYVEAIPMEVLNTVEVDWETIPQYMDRLDRHLGVNVGTLIGHSTVRYYVMRDDCQKRTATEDEIKAMQDVVRDGIEGGALGLSVSRNKGHYDPQGVHIPALWADEREIFGLGDVLRQMGTGIIQSGGGRNAELADGLMSRLSEATGRTVIYNNLGQTVREPDAWKQHMARVEETSRAGIRAYPLCSPNRVTQTFTMRNCQVFRGSPTWHPILLADDDEKLRAYADPAIRQKLHDEVIEHRVNVPSAGYSREWYNYMWVEAPALAKNEGLKGKTVGQIAKEQGKRVIDAFLDLVVEEKLETVFMQSENNVDDEAMARILTYPNAIVGLSDGGAHVQFHGGYGYSTRLLSEWVREKQVMSLEHAVRRLTFDSASALGIYDRGLLRPGMMADIVIFDPDTVRPLPETIVHDFPAGGWRVKEPAAGIHMTIVNGEVLLEDGRHTGALPGRVLRNTHYQASHA